MRRDCWIATRSEVLEADREGGLGVAVITLLTVPAQHEVGLADYLQGRGARCQPASLEGEQRRVPHVAESKRHLQTAHSMSPDQYRQDYGLPKEYPMVAPNYSEQRRTLAHQIGLGRKKGEKAKPKRTRKAKVDPSAPTE